MSDDLDDLGFDAPPLPESSAPQPANAAEHVPLERLRPRVRKLIENGPAPGQYPSRSEAVTAVAREARTVGMGREQVREILTDPSNKISESVLEKRGRARDRDVDRPLNLVAEGPLVLPVTDHGHRAVAFIGHHRRHLRWHREDFLDWNGTSYYVVPDTELRAEVRDFLRRAVAKDKDGNLTQFPVREALVRETILSLESETMLRASEHDPPCWLPGAAADDPPPREIIPCRNGLLDLRDFNLRPATPRFYTRHGVDVDYDPAAPNPKEWLRFLAETFGGETDQIDLLQEWVGYLISDDNSQEKILKIEGPRRSGKSTIRRILETLVPNSTGFDLGSLRDAFGLSQLVGRSCAFVDDMRVGMRTDHAPIVERLLAISGRAGRMSVNRKHRDHADFTFRCRFAIISNDPLELHDQSGTFASRFNILVTRVSVEGKEDTRLEERLRAEMPGILLWALEGLRRLRKRGRFIETQTSMDAREAMATAGSPILNFISEQCELEPEASVVRSDLHAAYVAFAAERGHKHLGAERFGEALLRARPELRSERPRGADGRRQRTYVGIRPRDAREVGGSNELPF